MPTIPEDPNDPTGRRRAYRAAGRMTRERIRMEESLDNSALEAVEASDVVVVRGQYDHVEAVLDALELPYTIVYPGQVGELRLRPDQLLVVNCPGQVGRAGVERIRTFVEAGGSLFSTDWALKHVIEPAFPGVLAYNEQPTLDAVVRIEIRDHDNPFLRGVMDGADDPQWWLESSSYPIRVLDDERVNVLLTSGELGAQWGESPVAVLFKWGDGEVFHMISHYYLQRTELRSARHNAPAAAYAAEKGVSVDAAMAADMAGLQVGDVESAQVSTRWMANVIADKKRRNQKRRSAPKERA